MEIAAFKVKSRNLLELTFGLSDIFWIPYSKTHQRAKFQPKNISYKGDMIFLKMTNEFY